MIGAQFKLVSHVSDVKARTRQRLGRVAVDTCEAIQERVETAMRSPKSGRVYKRPGGTHQASAPGEAPAVDTGALIGSGHVEKTGPMSADIVYGTEHALPMEFGAPARGIAPRPFLGPAMVAEVEEFEHRIADALAGVGESGRVRTRNP